MQVAVETTNGLERKLKVNVPAERVEESVKKRLQEVTRTAKIDGFRPGKVPPALIEKRFGESIRYEVVEDLIRSSLREALSQENITPAGLPEVQSLQADAGQALAYEAVFEVYPEIKLAPMQGISLEKLTAEVAEADVDTMLEKMRQQQADWQVVERPAQAGDQVLIDFVGTINGKAFDGGSAEKISLVLGSKRMIPGFEEGLAGANPGQQVVLKLEFPKDYPSEELAGKPAEFAVTIQGIKASVLPELNGEFAKRYGIIEGGMQKLREEVRENMQRQLQQALQSKLKQQVMDKLLELNSISVPQALIKAEIENLREQTLNWLKPMLKSKQAPNLPDEDFQERAQKRVTLGLLLAEFIKQRELKPDPNKVHELIHNMAASYEHPHEMEEYFYQNKERLAEMESLALENQLVDVIVSEAKIVEKPTSFAELVEKNNLDSN